MKPKSKPRIAPKLGALPAAKFKSRYPHVEALVECGGQISLSGRVQGGASAFGSKGFWAGVKAGGGGLVDTLLRRLDWAIAIGNQTGVRVDEISGVGSGLIAGGPPVQNRPMLRFPRIQSLIDGGGTIAFGDCKPGAAVASKSTGIVAILAFRNEDVRTLLRRLDWSIGVAESGGECLDEVFHSARTSPAEIAGVGSFSSKRDDLGIGGESERHGGHTRKIERAFSLLQVPLCVDDGRDFDLTAFNIHPATKANHDSTEAMGTHIRQEKKKNNSDGLSAPYTHQWVKVNGKWQRRRI
jgi:hypothetical protein